MKHGVWPTARCTLATSVRIRGPRAHRRCDIAADRFDAESGANHYQKALALTLATGLGMRPLVAHCHLGLGKLYHRTGKR